MAFDQNSTPKDLRPLNVARTLAEEPLILPASSTGRPVECFPPNSVLDASSPGSVPLFYPVSVSDAGIVGIGYGNVASGAAWCSPAGMPMAHPSINPAAGFNYSPNFANRITGCNAPDLASSVVTAAHGYAPNLGNWVGGNGVDKVGNDATNGVGFSASLGSRIVVNASDQVGNIPSSGTGYSPTIGQRPAGNGVDQASEEGDDSVSGRKVKFLCSYGGKILPRPSDGTLRYVGGQTRIISFRRDVSFNELVQKMSETCGQAVVIKYQLPDEDLDALVSVSCPDDLDNMMEEHEKLIERCSDGSAKLRVFLFSASELDSSGVVPFGDLNDSGQRYVDAVNGITEGITRKESVTSATSTQNSDFSGTEAPDSLFPGQGDLTGAPSSVVLSPGKNMARSHDAAAKLVGGDHGPVVYSDACAIPQVMSVAKSGPIQTSTFCNEAELDGSVTPLSQLQVLLQQSRMDIPQAAPYIQPFVDPRQEVTSHADYVQQPPQMSFLNPHLLGKAGSAFTQQQLYDNNPGLTSHQVIPTVQMTMAPPVSHVGPRPNVIQPLMQPQHNPMDPYHDESTSGPRIFQFPVGQSYSAYPVQVPSVVVGGNYGWVQIPSQDHVIFHDGLLPQQQVMIPDKIQRAENCYMCQNSLPHAHSDPVVQDQGDSGASPTSDSIPSYHGLPMEENLRAQATKKVMANEGVIEQGVGIKPRIVSNGEPLVGGPCTDTTVLSHNLEPQPEVERTLIQKSDGFDHPRNTVLQDVIGGASDKQSPSDGIVSTAPASYLDDVMHQPTLPVENWIKQDVLVNKPINNDIPPVGGTSIQTSECRIQESPKEYTNELVGIVSKADARDNWVMQDHLRPVDGRMDTLRVYNPEVFVNDDHSKLPFGKSSGIDQLVHESQHLVEIELLDNNVGRSRVVFDTNQITKTDMLPFSYTETSHGHNSRPVECIEVTQPPVWAMPGSHPQLQGGNHHKDDIMPSSLPLAGVHREVQDSSNSLFSNQDPWNMQHDTYYPPPRPSKAPLKKETKNHLGENLLGNSAEQSLEAQLESNLYKPFKQNLTLEHGQSAKVSTEDQMKQELQAVAEGVAASVLHSSTPSNLDLHASGCEDIEDGDVKSKAQDVKNKPPEKHNIGFSVSDGLGRLQVIKNCDLEELRELGSGTFGTVYHGKWRGSDVAIKRINDRCFAGKPSEQERMRADFWNEAIKLADLHHPNVVAFYGIVLDGPGGSIATVTEYMVNGSLRNALQKNERSLDKRKRLLIAMDVAFGMEYLHGKNIVHFDLKSDNLLVNLRDPHRPICKVGDLGLSKVKRQTLISGGVQGTLPWMAPELLNGSSSLVSEKVDVFSYGIVMWELLTGEEPYADLHYGAIIGGILSNTLRPPVPESCDPEWRSLMERSWSSEPPERPSFTEIADELRAMAARIPPKGQSQQQQQPPSSQSQVQK